MADVQHEARDPSLDPSRAAQGGLPNASKVAVPQDENGAHRNSRSSLCARVTGRNRHLPVSLQHLRVPVRRQRKPSGGQAFCNLIYR